MTRPVKRPTKMALQRREAALRLLYRVYDSEDNGESQSMRRASRRAGALGEHKLARLMSVYADALFAEETKSVNFYSLALDFDDFDGRREGAPPDAAHGLNGSGVVVATINDANMAKWKQAMQAIGAVWHDCEIDWLNDHNHWPRVSNEAHCAKLEATAAAIEDRSIRKLFLSTGRAKRQVRDAFAALSTYSEARQDVTLCPHCGGGLPP